MAKRSTLGERIKALQQKQDRQTKITEHRANIEREKKALAALKGRK